MLQPADFVPEAVGRVADGFLQLRYAGAVGYNIVQVEKIPLPFTTGQIRCRVAGIRCEPRVRVPADFVDFRVVGRLDTLLSLYPGARWSPGPGQREGLRQYRRWLNQRVAWLMFSSVASVGMPVVGTNKTFRRTLPYGRISLAWLSMRVPRRGYTRCLVRSGYAGLGSGRQRPVPPVPQLRVGLSIADQRQNKAGRHRRMGWPVRRCCSAVGPLSRARLPLLYGSC